MGQDLNGGRIVVGNRIAGIAIAIFALSGACAYAQSTGPRDLDELKKEAQLRADRKLPPVAGIKSEDMREALAGLNSLEPDAWAAAFSRIGDRYLAQGKAQEAVAPREARESYRHAWETYNTARWPTENSPGKKQAYAKALEAFQAYGRLLEPPLEVVRVPFEGKEIVGYLRLPAGVRPAPILFGISGLDTRKEDVAATSDSFLKRGIGLFAIDMPGTGQAPLKIDVGAERMFSRALDYLVTRSDVDAKRIVVRGQSWAGYWAALMGGQGARPHPRRGRARRRHPRLLPARMAKQRPHHPRISVRPVPGALRGVRRDYPRRVSGIRAASVAARFRLSR